MRILPFCEFIKVAEKGPSSCPQPVGHAKFLAFLVLGFALSERGKGEMRRIITGAAVACYVAALIIAVAALGLPVPKPAAKNAPGRPKAAPAPPSTPSTPSTPTAPDPSIADGSKVAPSPPTLRQVMTTPSEEDTFLQLAQKYQQAGDLKKAEAIYRDLLGKSSFRDTAAQRLGDLYYNAGDYRRAEEMYRESARVIRARNNPAPEPAQR